MGTTLKFADIPSELVAGELHKFPHIVKCLNSMWGHPEIFKYISKLLSTEHIKPELTIKYERRGKPGSNTRSGLPFSVFMELNRIKEAHCIAFPHIAPDFNAFKFTVVT